MPTTTLSSREFNHDTGGAKRATGQGPVIITDRGRPSHVLLSIRDYEALTRKAASIVDLLAMPHAAAVEFEPPRLGRITRPVELG
jgi:prevent-host-death family protein